MKCGNGIKHGGINMSKDYVPALNFNFLTPFYDLFVEILGYGGSQRKKVVDLLELKKGDNLLDVGCGTGTLLIIAKQKYPQIEMTGIDIDANVLNIAEKKTKKTGLEITYVETSSAKLSFPDAAFSVIVSSLVFHHLPTDVKKQTLKEIYRVLKSNGKFLLVDFGKREGIVLSFIAFVTEFFRLPERKTLQDNLQGNVPVYMKEAGFQVKEVAPRYRGVQFLEAKKI